MSVKDFIIEYYFIYFCDIYWTTWIIFDYVINYLRFEISEMMLWFSHVQWWVPLLYNSILYKFLVAY